jgi:hypothetical protein
MRPILYAAFLGAALWASAGAFGAAPAESGDPASNGSGAKGNVAGWRLCPSCGELNEPAASFCTYCGRDLDLGPGRAATGRGTAITLEPSVGFFGDFTELGPGFSFAAEGGPVREEITAFPVLDAGYKLHYDGLFFASGTHIYLTDYAIRPYAAVDVSLWSYRDDVIAEFGPGAGVRYGYGGRGSFFYCGLGCGAKAYSVWREYGPDTYEWDSQLWARLRLTHYYARFAGVSFAAETFFGGAVMTVGHAFTF